MVCELLGVPESLEIYGLYSYQTVNTYSSQPNTVLVLDVPRDGAYEFYLPEDTPDNISITCFVDGVRYIFKRRFITMLKADKQLVLEVDAKGFSEQFTIHAYFDPDKVVDIPLWDEFCNELYIDK